MKKSIVCRKCRRAGEKLFLKGEKCLGAKCPFAKRAYAPGQHGAMRRRLSEYGMQLKEKQKAKHIFLLNEERFRKIYQDAMRQKGDSGLSLLKLLEMRLDNVVYRLGLADSRRKARQMITHGHILVNGKKVDVPGLRLRIGDEVALAKNSIEKFSPKMSEKTVPEWLTLNSKTFSGKVAAEPIREQMESLIDESAIIEYYSR